VKYQAVIFDLFGTLIKNFRRPGYENVLAEMASILSVPREDFLNQWFDSFRERITGIFPTPEANIKHICQTLKIQVSEGQVKEAARMRLDYTKASMKPRPGALEVLAYLRGEDYKIGLISDCSGEIPMVWDNTPFAPFFDVTVFSCVAGIKKPDPRIYYLATDQLEVEPDDCLYIGDGSSHELTGALHVGMHPVLIRDPDEPVDAHLVEREEQWDGAVIISLKEVLNLIK
jgi:putative hydrolase of the HAD superfamily